MERKRKPGTGRKPAKPDYDAKDVLSQQMEAAVALYSANDHPSLQTIADNLSLNPIKVRKLLITVGVYKSEIANRVQRVFNTHRDSGMSYTDAITATMKELNLSKASVNAYLPYEKGVYFRAETDSKNLSAGAERQRHYRAVAALKKNTSEETLWNCIVAFRGYKFKTMSGLPFTYQFKRGRGDVFTKELWIDRREGSKSLAWSSITRTFDMVWAIDAGMWKIRQETTDFFVQNPSADNQEAKRSIISGSNIHGLDFRGMIANYTWDDKDLMIRGDFSKYELTLSLEPNSVLKAYFRPTKQRRNGQIGNLLTVYRYFKSCRNCIAHGNGIFTNRAENDYNAISVLSARDCGIKEFPKVVATIHGQPLKLRLRGVVGLYDVMLCIIYHYDILASDKIGIETEISKRWIGLQGVALCRNVRKRNASIRNYFQSIDMCPPI